jgi:multiple sugar transport system permease protein
MTSVFYIFFLRQTFKQIPDSLYRAAQVDGCGDFKYLTRVMIPIAKPTIITITIIKRNWCMGCVTFGHNLLRQQEQTG